MFVRTLKVRELGILNGVYMRVVRRICDRPNFDGSAGSDLDARTVADMPSLDCLILRRRLIYLQRLIKSDCRPLLASLSQAYLLKDGTTRAMPWVMQVRCDLRMCYDLSSTAQQKLPQPDEQPQRWYDLMTSDRGAWYEIVNSIIFFESQM